MKSFRRIFKSKAKEDNKENLDVSRHVTFHDGPERQSTKRSRQQIHLSQRAFDDMSHPAAAYHVPSKPRAHRPTQSCPGGPDSPRGGSSSDDDQSTLVADRAEFLMKERKHRTYTLNQRENDHTSRKYYQKMEIHGVQTSEYGSADPSPVSDVLRAVNHNENRYINEPPRFGDQVNYKRKYREYKERCRYLFEANARLREDLNNTMQQNHKTISFLTDEVNRLKHENETMKMHQKQMQAELASYQSNILSRHQSTFPTFNCFGPPNFSMMGQMESTPMDAGEQLASLSKLPSTGTTSSNAPTMRFSSAEPDETKNFRIRDADSMDDSSRTQEMSPLSNSSMERSRREREETSPVRTSSLVQLKDDGYSTTQSNQTLAPAEEEMKTPVKASFSLRQMEKRGTSSL